MIMLYIFIIYLVGWTFLKYLYKPLFLSMSAGYRLCFSWTAGNIIISTFFFFMAYFSIFTQKNVFYILLALLSICIVLALYSLTAFPDTRTILRHKLISIIPFIIICIFFINVAEHSLHAYLIDWDSVGMWFLKAKSLFAGDGFWNNAYFDNTGLYDFSNKTYPIGIPLMISGFYKLVGFVNDQAIQFYFIQFFLLIIFLTYELLSSYTKYSTITKLLIAIGLYCTPVFLSFAHNGYLDIPLGFFFLITTVIYIKLQNTYNIDKKLLWFSLLLVVGIFSFHIKNEGKLYSLFYILIATLQMMNFVRAHSRTLLKKYFLHILLWTILIITVSLWKYFSTIMKFPFYLDGAHLQADALTRIKVSLYFYVSVFLDTKLHSLTTIPALIILAYQVPLLLKKNTLHYLAPLGGVIIQLIFYTYIFAITTMPFITQLQTAFPRLLLQILPSLYAVIIFQDSRIRKKIFNKM